MSEERAGGTASRAAAEGAPAGYRLGSRTGSELKSGPEWTQQEQHASREHCAWSGDSSGHGSRQPAIASMPGPATVSAMRARANTASRERIAPSLLKRLPRGHPAPAQARGSSALSGLSGSGLERLQGAA